MTPALAAAWAVTALGDPAARKATVFINEALVVSVCRRFRHDARGRMEDFVLKIGRPNYAERRFIRSCAKAGESLPLRRPQLKFWPAKK
jgi:hypothetical protein